VQYPADGEFGEVSWFQAMMAQVPLILHTASASQSPRTCEAGSDACWHLLYSVLST